MTELLRLMLSSRYFEETTEELFKEGLIHGTTHLSNGQEGVQAGLCHALEKDDWIVPTHRCHGFTICKGSDPYRMFCEMFGSADGLAKGLGGSMHMPDRANCNLGSSAVVGSGVPLAVGLAFAIKSKVCNGPGFAASHSSNPKDFPNTYCPNISVAIFGDGASSRGSIHESMNIASIWKLPVLFLCENNLYGMSASSDKMISTSRIADRAAGYNIKSKRVNGNNVLEVYEAVREARKYICEGNGPFFLEALTYRQKGHSKSDRRLYRTAEEEAFFLEQDPILQFEKYLISENILSTSQINDLKKQTKQKILDALSRAKESRCRKTPEDYALSLSYATEEIS